MYNLNINYETLKAFLTLQKKNFNQKIPWLIAFLDSYTFMIN